MAGRDPNANVPAATSATAAQILRRIMPVSPWYSCARQDMRGCAILGSANSRRRGDHMNELTRRELLEMVAAGVLLSGTATSAMAARDDRIIISGASGQLGGQAVKDLLAMGVPAKNLILVSRTPDVLLEYTKLGAATRFGDFGKPESLAAAFAGGTRMLLISIGNGAGPRPVAHGHAIDAARTAGIKQIAYTS